MSGIILPRRFKQQPQSSVRLAPAYRDAELLSLFNDGTGRDIARGNDLTHSTAAPTRVLRDHGHAFNFNGSQRLVSNNTITPGAKFTVFAWVRPSVLNTGFSRIVETEYGSGFYLGSSSGTSAYTWIVNNSSPLTGCSGGQQVIGRRDFICGVFDGTSRILYVNGVQVASASATAPFAARKVTVGSNPAGGEAWRGDIDTVGILNRAASAAEIYALYQYPWQLAQEPVRRLWAGMDGAAAALAGEAQAAAAATGALATQIKLAGAAPSVATAAGALTTQIKLAGNVVAVSTASGALTAKIQLSGAALAQAISTAALSTGINLSASSVAEAAASGMLDTVIRLMGSAVGEASASGNLSTGASGEMEANAQAMATASASLTAQIRLNAVAIAQAAALGELTSGIRLEGAAQGNASASGEITTSIILTAEAISQAIAAGSLTAQIQLGGIARAETIASAALYTAINLAGSATGNASAHGDLSIGALYSSAVLTAHHALAGGWLHSASQPVTNLITEVRHAS